MGPLVMQKILINKMHYNHTYDQRFLKYIYIYILVLS
jgi:hypothetical protein